MSGEGVSVHSRNGVTRIELNRPEKRNALSAAMVEEMLHAVQVVESDTRLLVIRGQGKSFCAGFDFSDLESQSDGDLALRFIRIEQLLQTLHQAPYQTLALGHGACFGAGADLFAVCNQRVAAPGTRFRMPGLQFGIVLGTRRFASLVGAGNARSILENAAVFTAEEAQETGFVDRLESPEQWENIIRAADERSTVLSRENLGRLLSETTDARPDQDLAALVRSVSAPGLRDRIVRFVSSGS